MDESPTMHELHLAASGHPSRSDEGCWRARCRTDAERADAKYNLNNHKPRTTCGTSRAAVLKDLATHLRFLR